MSRLKEIREARGLDANELAKRLGLSVSWYYDLESDRPNWTAELSVSSLRRLARELDVSSKELLANEGDSVLTSYAFVERIREYLITTDMTATQASAKIGWDIDRLIADTRQVQNLSIDGLRDICAELGLDWMRVLDAMKVSE